MADPVLNYTPEEQAYDNYYELTHRDENLAAIDQELSQAKDPAVRAILTQERQRVAAQPDAVLRQGDLSKLSDADLIKLRQSKSQDLSKLSDDQLIAQYKALGGRTRGPELGTAANIAESPAGRGVIRGAVMTAGALADLPENTKDLMRASLGYLHSKVYPEDDLIDVDPQRTASSAIYGAVNKVFPLTRENESASDKAKGTLAELATQGLLGGGVPNTAKGLVYGTVLPAVGGTIGEQVAGDTGKIVGSLAGGAAQLGEAGAKLSLRGINADSGAVKAMTDAGLTPVSGDLSTWGAVVQGGVLGRLPGGWFINRQVLDKRSQQMAQGLGKAAPVHDISPLEAGEVVQEGLENWKTRFFGNYQKLQTRTAQVFPDSVRVKPNNFEQALTDLTTPNPGAPNSTGLNISSDLRDKLDALRKDLAGGGWITAGALGDIKTAIGLQAYPKSGLVAQGDQAAYQRLFRALGQDLEGAASHYGPSIGPNGETAAYLAQRKENKYYSAGMTRVKSFFNSLDKKADPRAVYDALMSGKGAEQVRTVMKSLTRPERDAVASAVIEQMGQAQASRRGVGPQFDPETFLTQWNRITDRGAKDALFAGTSNRQMTGDLDKIAAAAAVMRQTGGVMPNPSGTSHAGAAAVLLPWLATDWVTALSTVGSATGASYLLTNPTFVHWLAGSMKVPESAVAGQLIRLDALATRSKDADFKAAVAAYSQASKAPKPGKKKINVGGGLTVTPPTSYSTK